MGVQLYEDQAIFFWEDLTQFNWKDVSLIPRGMNFQWFFETEEAFFGKEFA